MGKKIWIGLGLAVVLVLGIFIYREATAKVDDQKMIQDVLDQSLEASKRGEPGGVLDLISNQFTYNDQDAGSPRRQIADVVRKTKPDVTFANRRALLIHENTEARITTPATLSFSLGPTKVDAKLEEVVLIFSRKPAMKYLFIPTHTWKLDKVYFDESAIPSDVLSGIGGGMFGGF